MRIKDFPFSTFSLIDIVSSTINAKMYGWAETKNYLATDDNRREELEQYSQMSDMGAFVLITQPDECGDLRFEVGNKVVERSSGIFSTTYEIKEIKETTAILVDDNGGEVEVQIAKIREDGVAFLPSSTLKNLVEISGAPISDSDMMNMFLCSTLNRASSSMAWTELRYIASVPEDESVQGNPDAPEAGTNFYTALVDWVKNVWQEENKPFNVGDLVLQNIQSQIVNGTYTGRNSNNIGIIESVTTDHASGARKYVIRLTNGGVRNYFQWELTRLVDTENIQPLTKQ